MQNNNQTIHIRVTKELYELIKDNCIENEITISQATRKLWKKELKKVGKK